jgi:hypothetical protein
MWPLPSTKRYYSHVVLSTTLLGQDEIVPQDSHIDNSRTKKEN